MWETGRAARGARQEREKNIPTEFRVRCGWCKANGGE